MIEATAVIWSLAVAVAFGLPGAFVFGRAIGREDERAGLPELRPNAEVRFQPRDGLVTRYAVAEVVHHDTGQALVILQDLVSARMVRRKYEDVEGGYEPLDDAMRNYGGRR